MNDDDQNRPTGRTDQKTIRKIDETINKRNKQNNATKVTTNEHCAAHNEPKEIKM